MLARLVLDISARRLASHGKIVNGEGQQVRIVSRLRQGTPMPRVARKQPCAFPTDHSMRARRPRSVPSPVRSGPAAVDSQYPERWAFSRRVDLATLLNIFGPALAALNHLLIVESTKAESLLAR